MSSFLEGLGLALNTRERRREFDANNELARQEFALRQAAEARAAAAAQRQADEQAREAFMGPGYALQKTPYGGAAASDIGTLQGLWETRKDPMEADLAPGVQGPPALQSPQGREDARAAAFAGIEDKVRSMFDARYVNPAIIRARASADVAGIRADALRDTTQTNADARIRAAEIAAEGARDRAAGGQGQKANDALDKDFRATVDKYNPGLARNSTLLGASANMIMRMREIGALPESVDFKLTPQDIKEFYLAIARNLGSNSGGGQVAHQLVNEISPESASIDLARAAQYVSGGPKDARVEEWVKRGMKTLARMDRVARDSQKDMVRQGVIGHRDSIIHAGKKGTDWLAAAGFSPEEIALILDQKESANPATGRVLVSPEGVEYVFSPDDPEYETAIANGYKPKMGKGM